MEKGPNYPIYEFTVLSFLTYFIFEANRRHHYMKMSADIRKSDLNVVMHVCKFSRDLVNTYFPNYYKNKYVNLLTPKEIELKQRLGTWLFVALCRINKLELFAKLYYQFM